MYDPPSSSPKHGAPSKLFHPTTHQDELAERIDWVIQESTLEGMQPWASAVFAHNSYFSNFDLIMFLINRLNEGQEEGRGEEENISAEETKAAAEDCGVSVGGLAI